MKHSIIALISIGLSLASSAALAAPKIVDVAKITMTCKEVVTGSDVDIKIEQTHTRTELDGGGSVGDVSKRVIDLRVRGDFAHSEMQKSQLGTDGSIYKYESVFFDEEKKQYPIQLLRLKAKVTKGDISHLVANIVLPESRLQSSTFDAYAYLSYSLPNFPDNEYTMGLAQLKCQNIYTRLEAEPCLSIKDEQEIARLEKEPQPSPFEKAMLRSLKARTVKCPH